ncbi:protein Wnt-16-like [Anguilla anguilla]|uniref:protein Wnt-16-like n=1 Tax=Anguilla anguilla TaxID=7936 RepID=UPI0015ABB01A|nr:protein Wnt-16-like [Anguilla anguilla]
MDGRADLGIYQMCVVLLVLFSVCPLLCRGNWMWLGVMSAGVPENLGCESLPLTNEQKDLCRRKPYLLPSIKDGARLGISECQTQFKHERWNCSTTKDLSVFGYELNSGTKETAFIFAVMAAGLVHAVTRSCSAGNVTDCACDGGLPGRGTPSGGGWHWGGCSDHVQYGSALSRHFIHRSAWNVSAPHGHAPHGHAPHGHALLAMNQHNSEAGRQAVAKTMSTACRCHGVSGSCAVRTCWRTLAAFGRVGVFLKERYEAGVQVQGRSERAVRRKERARRRVPVAPDELVFLRKSPNYCLEDRRLGVAGTRGRSCSRASPGPDSCSLLCCGRGYNTRLVRHAQRCDCKFVWCCYVRCRLCESVSDVHTCK